MTSSRKVDMSKFGILGYLKGLNPLHKGMYFLIQLMDILSLQNTYLYEEAPPAGSGNCPCIVQLPAPVSGHSMNCAAGSCYTR